MDGEDWCGLAAGGGGFIGAHLVEALMAAGEEMDIHNIFTRPSRHFHTCPVKLAGRQGSICSKRGTIREPLRSV
jgi:hypothetical protein